MMPQHVNAIAIAGLASALFLFGAPCRASSEDNAAAAHVLNSILPSGIEVELALSAAPEHLRSAATVYVYGGKGFSKVKPGSNGFTCLLNRDAFLYGAAAFKPTCWDSNGTDSYVPVMLRVGEMLAAGKSAADVQADIAAGFKAGKYHSPSRTGIAYMLAGDVQLEIDTGKIIKTAFPGHYMIYAPGVSNADIGYAAGKSAEGAPFIFSGGAGGTNLGYLIAVPHPHN